MNNNNNSGGIFGLVMSIVKYLFIFSFMIGFLHAYAPSFYSSIMGYIQTYLGIGAYDFFNNIGTFIGGYIKAFTEPVINSIKGFLN